MPIVFLGWKPRLLLAEVCKLVVLKGFGGFPLLEDSFIFEIFAIELVNISTIFTASFLSRYFLSLFVFSPLSLKSADVAILFSPTFFKLASKLTSLLPQFAFISKYKDLTNFNLSSSLSTISLIAGPWTLPVDIKAPPRSLTFGEIS